MTTRATRGPRRRTVVALAVILAVLGAFVVRLVDTPSSFGAKPTAAELSMCETAASSSPAAMRIGSAGTPCRTSQARASLSLRQIHVSGTWRAAAARATAATTAGAIPAGWPNITMPSRSVEG